MNLVNKFNTAIENIGKLIDCGQYDSAFGECRKFYNYFKNKTEFKIALLDCLACFYVDIGDGKPDCNIKNKGRNIFEKYEKEILESHQEESMFYYNYANSIEVKVPSSISDSNMINELILQKKFILEINCKSKN